MSCWMRKTVRVELAYIFGVHVSAWWTCNVRFVGSCKSLSHPRWPMMRMWSCLPPASLQFGSNTNHL
ncbi:unnamed protein product [Toxocara canis]|uniref:Secreted protein n=1 Tax=Toxocara canis TaxID=6265 RepID=A0A183U9Q6_TOXCA|nr:unnamed protein product [Toxocara canis]